jgi:hypothetical protein
MDEIAPRVEEVINDPPPDGNVMDTTLTWIGIDNEATRNRIQVEGFGSFDDLASMKEKDIRDLAESYGRWTASDGCFIFGIRRIWYLIGMVPWVHDFTRIGESPGLDMFGDNGAAFCAAL